MELLKSQKNKVFELIEEAGFSPSEFEWEIKKNESRVVLHHKNSNYYFTFDLSNPARDIDRNRRVYCSPGNDIEIGSYITYSYPRFKEQLRPCKEWFQYLKIEIEQPDKWEELFKEGNFFKSGLDEKENSKFSYGEVKQLETSGLQFKARITKIGLKEPDIQTINRKLDYLIEKSKVFGKIDWRNMAIGIFTGMATDLSMNYSEEIKTTFIGIVKTAFKTVLLLS